MSTYEISTTLGRVLGEVKAIDKTDAREKAKKRWKDFPEFRIRRLAFKFG